MDRATTAAAADLEAALHRVRRAFAGMTARPDESNCPCHWGSEEELRLLKTPDVPLDPDLLHRTWSAPDWRDHAAVTRRVLPQFAEALAAGECDEAGRAGRSLAMAGWRTWPEAPVVRAFLDAWWARTLERDAPPRPAYDVFETCVVASGSVTPWLAAWSRRTDPTADRHLLAAARWWVDDLERDEYPSYDVHWDDDEEELARELSAWLGRHAPARLAALGAEPALVDRLTMLGVPSEWRRPDEGGTDMGGPPTGGPATGGTVGGNRPPQR
ncbi:hypothetical protein ACF068_05255 [Streptomyces sp. NPDC016309]|uniref:hypothetical protein n=1 Tax=Streptomyces sp. NPDC016309 TaxID=3364965 RepID=UPI0036FFCA9E